jgi:hypothetical protein
MKYFFLCSFILLAACTKGFNFASPPEVTPPAEKPTALCLEAQRAVTGLLKDIDSQHQPLGAPGITYLADHTCVVKVDFMEAALAQPLLAKMKSVYGSYTNYIGTNDSGEPAIVPLWLFEPYMMWIPIVDPATGKELDNMQTFEECKTAAAQFKGQFGNALVTAQKNSSTSLSLRCYVEVEFTSDEDFKSFLTWKNPYSFDGGKPTQMNFQRETGVVATVTFRVIR